MGKAVRSTRRGWWVAAAGGAALGVGVALLLSAHRLPPAYSVAAAAPPTSSPITPAGPTSSARVAPVPVTPFRPTSMSLSAFGVTAPVDPALTSGGVLDPPSDPARVGWWAASALSGTPVGTTVLVGHVDGPNGPGALYRLVHTHADDRISLTGSDEQRTTYVVTSLRYHVKGTPLPASLFHSDGPAGLVIISCGGPFDRTTDQYQDNVIVEATAL